VRRGAVVSALSVLGVACSHDWDDFDPRIGGAATGGSGAGVGGVGGSSGSGTGGSGAGGSGGLGSGGTSGGAGGTIGTGGATGTGGSSGSGGSAASGGTGGTNGAGGSGGTGGTGGAAGTGGSGAVDAGPGTKSYAATVADCINPMTLNPDTCESLTGAGEMNVDLADTPNNPHHAYLRFDLDGAFAGRTVTAVRLQLHTTDDQNAGSPSSGEVWSVATFVRADLFTGAPAKQGSAPIAADIGTVARMAPVEFSLPVTSVTANGAACFGIFPLSTEGVDYYNDSGAQPPQLVVDYQ
jgi:hypothetical protein